MKTLELYNRFSREYDNWFDEHPVLFESELKELEKGEEFGSLETLNLISEVIEMC